MAKQDLVTVENIKNPSVKRQMTVASAKFNSKIWRLVDSAPAVEVKKKDVAPAAVKPSNLPETANSFVNETNEDSSATSADFAKIESEKETLQAEYEIKSGKKPDGRWNESKLKEKIKELKPNDDAAH